MRTIAPALLTALVASACAAGALAVGTSHWTHANESDFKKGTFHNVVATNLGDLKLSRAVKTLLEQDPRVGSVSALAEAPDGTIYAGTGPHAVLLRVKDDKVTVAAALEENTSINALLFDRQGRLLIATGGARGRVLRLDHPEKAEEPPGGPAEVRPAPADDDCCALPVLPATPPARHEPASAPASALAKPATTSATTLATTLAPPPATTRASAPASAPAATAATRPAGEAPVEIFAAEGVQYVWALQQTPDGKLYAGTGPGGQLFEIDYGDGATGAKGFEGFGRSVLLDSDENNVLSLLSDGKDLLYAGTDPNGLIYRVNRKTRESFVLYDAAEAEVTCLALDGKGNLYAGTAEAEEGPGGADESAPGAGAAEKAGRPEGASGAPLPGKRPNPPNPPAAPDPNPGEPNPIPKNKPKSKPGKEPAPEGGDEEVWENAPKRRQTVTSAGSRAVPGPIGAQHRINSVLRTDPGQVAPLETFGAAGEWLTPTSALLVDKPADPKPPVPPQPPGGPGKKDEKPAKPAATAPANKETATPEETGKARAGGNAVYRIDPDGFVTEIFRQNVLVLSMVEKDGVLLVGTGNEGLVYQVNPSAEETLVLAKVEPKHVLSLLAARDGRVVLGLANVGGLAAMSSGYAPQGTFTSPVLDATQISRFGKMNLHGSLPAGTSLTVSTRSGNVQDPAKAGWSPWSAEIPASEYLQVPSPAARFLQYRLTLGSAASPPAAAGAKELPPDARKDVPKDLSKESPVVDGIDVAYQMPNLAPVVKGVKIGPKSDTGDDPAAGKGEQANPANPPRPAAPAQNRYQTIAWDAEDANGDALQFSLYFRSGNRGPWILLKEKLTDTHFDWDTRTAADGRYVVKVVASDAAANEPGQGKTGSRVSDPFVVDNTPPVIGDLKSVVQGGPKTDARTGRVTFAVRVEARLVDRTSTVAACDYAVDSSADWQAVLPSDKIFDSPEEEVRFTLPNLPPGPHQITLRATDAKGNQAFESVLVTVEPPGAKTAKR